MIKRWLRHVNPTKMPTTLAARLVVLGVTATSLSFTSCFNSPNLDERPRITFEGWEYRNSPDPFDPDSLRITVRFEDGNGDLGLNQGDTLPPYRQFVNGSLNLNHYNWLADYFEYNPNTGNFDSLATGLSYRGRFAPVYQAGQLGKPLTGTITYNIQVLNFPDDRDIMFKVMIKDRALNSSNRITVGPLRLPRQ